ncbi:hypothetical protein LWI29_018916 [Acer saccharum]|uniref:Ribosome biogenesis protein NOP53 n=1 Tax=Acer saccharum TaxID=4024 RepID=A0AA39SJB1_ACESA|nr:hypothetical protein LWI29_018916 [Acer saccharum]
MVNEEVRVQVPLPLASKNIVDPNVIIHNNDQQINDEPLHNEIVTTEPTVEEPREIALRRSQREKRSAISNDYMVYLQESDYDIGMDNDPVSYQQAIEIIPAVEVEAPGCSFNPAYESRQESLAQAVAEEMQKVYQNELGPEPIPFTVPGHAIDDEDRYFLEVDNASDDEGNVENLSENAQEKSLPDIIQEIAKENEENKKRHMRRLVAKQERLKVRPPRLGRHKFEPAPTQVLLSEEINGSLRKLKVS